MHGWLQHQEMRIIAFITEPKTIYRILDHLHRTRTSNRRQRAALVHGSGFQCIVEAIP